MRRAFAPIALMLIAPLGCAKQTAGPGATARPQAGDVLALPAAPAGDAPAPAAAPAGDAGANAAPAVLRKIIHTATLELLADDFDAARQEVARLVEAHQGLIAQSEIAGSPGAPRAARWVVRVPVQKYQPFVDAASRIGESVVHRTDAQDVSEQFFDLEARLKTKREEEERLRQLLKDATGKLTEVLEVERELTRVRGEIEQADGRLHKLANLVELTTVTVTVRERKGYVSPEAPAFGVTVSRTFHDSADALVGVGKAVVLAAVALAPWLPVLAVLGAGVWWSVRRANRACQAPAG
jgi:Domain of unknown function (DUF4349)